MVSIINILIIIFTKFIIQDDDDDTLIDSESANPIKHSMDKSNECLYRIITLTDAQQAIQTMEIHQQSPHNDISEMSCKKPDKSKRHT